MSTQPSRDLETFDNPNPERDYTIHMRIPEFTCLCPKTGQPDFATLYLDYVPDARCVELKSLKLYVWSFRDDGAFHEAVTNRILGDLVGAAQAFDPHGVGHHEAVARVGQVDDQRVGRRRVGRGEPRMSRNVVVIGTQWGDEGKGKVVDFLAHRFDVVARFQGGPNAGHTVTFDGRRHALHHIPSGVFRRDTRIVVGNGTVVDLETVLREIDELLDASPTPVDQFLTDTPPEVDAPEGSSTSESARVAASGSVPETGRVVTTPPTGPTW